MIGVGKVTGYASIFLIMSREGVVGAFPAWFLLLSRALDRPAVASAYSRRMEAAMHRHIQHGPRRRWLAPWKRICMCGLGSFPCYAVQMLEAQARMQPPPPEVPAWNGATQRLDELPLLTPGQAHRAGPR